MKSTNYNQQLLVYILLFISGLTLAYFIFLPAITGPFYIDDAVHLKKLRIIGGVDDWQSFQRFIFSGTSGSGRLLGFMSMLVESQYWPHPAIDYKKTNILIHLLNSSLVFWLATLLAAHSRYIKHANSFALMVFLIWLIHPIQLSTTMLVIQRFTLVMATLCLSGMILYLKGRATLTEKPKLGLAMMTVGIFIGGFLGTLAKDPGILVAAYILCIEVLLIRDRDFLRSRLWKVWSSVFIFSALALLLVLYVIWMGKLEEFYLKRDFSPSERSLTQLRVLADYLKAITLPQASAMGPFHDDYQHSKSLIEPISTLLCLVFWCSVITISVVFRKRFPIFLFGLMWFLAGHSLESSQLPLELYFEHRNYLPMLGICFIVAWVISEIVARKKAYIILPLFYFIYLTFTSVNSAQIWGNTALQHEFWAHHHPRSWRLVSTQAIENKLGKSNQEVRQNLRNFMEHEPLHAGAKITELFFASCLSNEAPDKIIGELISIAPTAKYEHASPVALEQILVQKKKGNCAQIDYEDILEISDAFLSNPRFIGHPRTANSLLTIKAKVYKTQGRFSETLETLDLAYQQTQKFDTRLEQAMIALTANRPDLARKFVEEATSSPVRFYEQRYRDRQVARANEILDAISKAKE